MSDLAPYLRAVMWESISGDSDLHWTVAILADFLRSRGDSRYRALELTCILPHQGSGPTEFVVQTPMMGSPATYDCETAALAELGERVIRYLARPCPVCGDFTRYARHVQGWCRRCEGLGVVERSE